MKTVVTMGELMMRLASPHYERLLQSPDLCVSFCGAEANVAVCLQHLGQDARFVTALPDNPLGRAALSDLRRFGVDVTSIIFQGDRLGLLFLEKGASQRASKVVYDRKCSSFSLSRALDYDWSAVFDGASWFHFTGINPALGENVYEICKIACLEAKQRGITISCDINYRSNLWSRERAAALMSNLMPYVDVCIANEEDIADVFGIKSPCTDAKCGVINREGYGEVGRQVAARFGCRYVAFTLRESISANDNRWSAALYAAEDEKVYYSQENYLIHIVDRVGAGDSFAGGLIYALLQRYELQEAIDFATGVSCLKHSIEGDYCRTSKEEVIALLKTKGSGRIIR